MSQPPPPPQPWESAESLLENLNDHAGGGSADPQTSSGRAEHIAATDANGDIIPVGDDCSALELFRKRQGPWTQSRPFQTSLLAELPQHQAIVVRTEDDEGNGVWRLHSISIRSRHLRRVLAKAFQGYPGINIELKDLTFNSPFREFFFRWSRIQDILEQGSDELATSHTRLLIATLQPELQGIVDRATDMSRLGVIDFPLLWTLYEPTTEVFLRLHDHPQLALVNETGLDAERGFFVVCRVIDFDGDNLGFRSMKQYVTSFDGVKSVTDLPIFPSQRHQQIDSVTEQLQLRGRKFLAFCGCRYVEYSGFYENFDSFCGPNREYIEQGRVMIDAKALKQNRNEKSPELEPLEKVFAVSPKYDRPAVRHFRCGTSYMMPKQQSAPKKLLQEQDDPTQTMPMIKLPEDSLPYCIATVRGYNLLNKKWGEFYLDSISEIKWSHMAYKQLLLRPQYKKLILAVVKNHAESLGKYDDIIPGKGQGLTLLLTGTPGVGKTLTAESVAEEMQKPLYAMSAGELGFESKAVEQALQKVLVLCQKWNAVLLLDECDVFLEHRSNKDLHRNALVATFLRMLEYYKGILILTTNRASVVDRAFQSRIHLTLKYSKLDQSTRQRIWKTFIQIQPSQHDVTPETEVTEAEIESLAEQEFNGREIKNIVRTARLLAAEDKVPLKHEHILCVLELKRDSESTDLE